MNVVRIEKHPPQQAIPIRIGLNRSNCLSIGTYIKYYFTCRRADIFIRQSTKFFV